MRLNRLSLEHVLKHFLPKSTALAREVYIEIQAAHWAHFFERSILHPDEEIFDSHFQNAHNHHPVLGAVTTDHRVLIHRTQHLS